MPLFLKSIRIKEFDSGLFYFIFIPLLFSCETPYELEITGYVKEYVVDGQISDQAGPHRIKLTFSSEYDTGPEGINLLVRGAIVTISDHTGAIEYLSENEPGIYETSGSFRAVSGNSYVLYIRDGFEDELISWPETMPTGPDSTGVYYEYTGNQGEDNPGHWVWVIVNDPSGYDNYYRWNWEGAYIFNTYFDGPPGATTCWRFEYDKDLIQLATDRYFNGNTYRHRICFIPYFSSAKYLVTIYQRSISKEAYKYFEMVDEQLNQAGGIFDLPPATIRGNMYCLNDPSINVLGYFMVASYQKIPVLINRNGLGTAPNVRTYPRNVFCSDLPNSVPFSYDPTTWPDGWD